MTEAILTIESINTLYGESHILRGVSASVGGSEVVALLGRNGAGKTTTLRSVMGLTPARDGSIRLSGTEIRRLRPHVIARMGVGYVPQGRRIFGGLSVLENLRIAARPGRGGWTLKRVFELFPRLGERQSQDGYSLSGGEQQQLAIARALLSNPTLLLMDEPSEGLAPTVVHDLRRVIGELKETGLSILLIEQNYALALAHADRVYVLSSGEMVFHGPPDRLDADEEVKRRYLGVHASGASPLPASGRPGA